MLLKKSQVQAIIGKAKQNNRVYYLVKWTDKEPDKSSWELSKSFRNIKETVTDFNNNLPTPISYPYIHDDYKNLLQDKLNSNQTIKRGTQQTILKGKVETILGKAKFTRNTFYLVKWQSMHVSSSTWQESYKLSAKVIAKFNNIIKSENIQLPYIDEKTIEEMYQKEQGQKDITKEKKSKKQSLRDKKEMKKNIEELKFVIEHFRKKLKRIAKIQKAKMNEQCHERALKMTENGPEQEEKQYEQTQNENNKVFVKFEAVDNLPENDINQDNEEEEFQEHPFNQQQAPAQKVQFVHNKDLGRQVNQLSKLQQGESDSFNLPPLLDDEDQWDKFNKERVINKIKTEIQKIQNNQEKLKLNVQSDTSNLQSIKYAKKTPVQPKKQYVTSSSESKHNPIVQISSSEEKHPQSHRPNHAKPSANQKATKSNSLSNEMKNLGKIILVRRQNKIKAISGTSKEEQLYRFQYEKRDGIQVKFWTTSQVKKLPNHFEPLLDYLETLAFGHATHQPSQNRRQDKKDKL